MANEIRVEKCFYDLNEYMDYSGFLTRRKFRIWCLEWKRNLPR